MKLFSCVFVLLVLVGCGGSNQASVPDATERQELADIMEAENARLQAADEADEGP
ncbi:hypothetical protein [Neorhodopirellula lusitana]|uniref:hypothetical protein n=1 Tax=Neorhodopirellula lusitana TaxID=445327 RepID=UPI00384B1F7B